MAEATYEDAPGGSAREGIVTGGGSLTIHSLPVGAAPSRGLGWWGMMSLILTEAFLFGYLLFSFYYMAAHYGREWMPPELPSFRLSGPNTVMLIASSVAVWLGERALKRERRLLAVLGLAAGIVLGAVFVYVQWLEWMDKPFSLASNSYGSLFFIVTGFHMAHVIGGLLILLPVTVWTALGFFDGRRHSHVSNGAACWHFVDAVWLAVFFTFYIFPHLDAGNFP